MLTGLKLRLFKEDLEDGRFSPDVMDVILDCRIDWVKVRNLVYNASRLRLQLNKSEKDHVRDALLTGSEDAKNPCAIKDHLRSLQGLEERIRAQREQIAVIEE